MEHFDFKPIGKQEMIVPYNTFAVACQAKQDDLLRPKHLNPDRVRRELHRVRVVEATLRDGKRHVYGKRTFDLDGDSWTALASDEHDPRGQLYRTGCACMAPSNDLPAPCTDMFGHYDLVSGICSLTGFIAETGGLQQASCRCSRVHDDAAARPSSQGPMPTPQGRSDWARSRRRQRSARPRCPQPASG